MVRRGIIGSPTPVLPGGSRYWTITTRPRHDPSRIRRRHDPSPPGLREQLAATIAAGRPDRPGPRRAGPGRARRDRGRGQAGRDPGRHRCRRWSCSSLLFVPVGGTLFLGEWLFGSIGWGLLLGTELAIGGAVLLVLAALYVPAGRIVGRFVLALLAGVVVAVVLALDLPHQAFTSIGALGPARRWIPAPVRSSSGCSSGPASALVPASSLGLVRAPRARRHDRLRDRPGHPGPGHRRPASRSTTA